MRAAAMMAVLAMGCRSPAADAPARDHEAAKPPAIADAASVPPVDAESPPSPAQLRCIEEVMRAVLDAAQRLDLPEGEFEVQSSADFVQVAYVIIDADTRVPTFAIRIGQDPSANGSAAGTWTSVPDLPRWFAALKPTSPAMPIRWPDHHLELRRDGLVGEIVGADTKNAVALEAAVVACIR